MLFAIQKLTLKGITMKRLITLVLFALSSVAMADDYFDDDYAPRQRFYEHYRHHHRHHHVEPSYEQWLMMRNRERQLQRARYEAMRQNEQDRRDYERFIHGGY